MLLAIGVLAVVTGTVAGVMQNRTRQRENQIIANLLLVAKEQDQNWEHTVSLYANVLNGKVTLEEEGLQKLEQELLRYGIKGEYIYQTRGQKFRTTFYICVYHAGWRCGLAWSLFSVSAGKKKTSMHSGKLYGLCGEWSV